ncbi:hypothetical protein GGI20_001621 [Coemansia sp. BCRC 34301]|nr:hypothetical protein GGI20_001621 [Coemansia sp. BCRC 34301]
MQASLFLAVLFSAVALASASVEPEHGRRDLLDNILSGIEDFFGGSPSTPTTTPTRSLSKASTRATASETTPTVSNYVPLQTPTGGDELPTSTKIAMGVAIPVGLVLVAAVAVLLVKLRGKKIKEENKDRHASFEVNNADARDELLVTIGGAGEVEEYAPPTYTELPENNRPSDNNKK